MGTVQQIIAMAARLGLASGLSLPLVLLFLAVAAVLLVVGPKAVAAMPAPSIKPGPPADETPTAGVPLEQADDGSFTLPTGESDRSGGA